MKTRNGFGRPGILLCVLASLAVTAVKAAPLPVEIVEDLDDHRIVLYLEQSRIDAIPAWRPGAGDPPMRLKDAVALTLEWVESKKLLENAHIYEITYRPVHNHETQNRWYFLVELRQAHAGRHYLAVLPDGTIIPANEEPSR